VRLAQLRRHPAAKAVGSLALYGIKLAAIGAAVVKVAEKVTEFEAWKHRNDLQDDLADARMAEVQAQWHPSHGTPAPFESIDVEAQPSPAQIAKGLARYAAARAAHVPAEPEHFDEPERLADLLAPRPPIPPTFRPRG
jgi:hypothetical protein